MAFGLSTVSGTLPFAVGFGIQSTLLLGALKQLFGAGASDLITTPLKVVTAPITLPWSLLTFPVAAPLSVIGWPFLNPLKFAALVGLISAGSFAGQMTALNIQAHAAG